MGIKGEPPTTVDPAQGLVWRAIVEQIDVKDSESEWVSVSDTERTLFARHPWSIGGGGAAELKATLEEATSRRLSSIASEIGIGSVTGEDEVFLLERPEVAARFKIESTRTSVTGDMVRDWVAGGVAAIWLYDDQYVLKPSSDLQGTLRFLWPYRSNLSTRKRFGTLMLERGLKWYEWQELYPSKLVTPLTITFAFVATHNHFVLELGGKVFNRSAPVVKLSADATENDYLGVLGVLNSSVACFWAKQVFHNKGSTVDQHGARQRTEAFEDFYEFTSTGLAKFPLPDSLPTEIAGRLHSLARRHLETLPHHAIGTQVPSRETLNLCRESADDLLFQMIGLQEELDWHCYELFGVLDDSYQYKGNPPRVRFGERAFEIALARQCAEGAASTTWFVRHGVQPIADLPSHWPEDYREIVEHRIRAIARSRDLALIERPECKRRWARDDWGTLEKAALETWLLNRLEAPDRWPRDIHPAPKLLSVRELVDALSGDDNFRRALDLYAGVGSDAHAAIVPLVQRASVPYLDALTYTESGLRKRAVWLDTWALQRREDYLDREVERRMAGSAPAAIKQEQARRKSKEIGSMPIPPEYKIQDFCDAAFWKLRGPLDVRKEQFICFPGLERANDPGSPMVLWAGYDAKARALALTGYLYELQQREGANTVRLTPSFAGLDEMLPWVHQWHPEVDEDLGMSTGDYLQGLLDAQLAQHGLTIAEVRAWKPPAPVRRTRGRRSVTT